ncbi:hypothetical protein N7493_011584 [Penicillium malachiteum]|uniref:Uncharacterized protein n=1 Tax=Penicillium malachiteum TaxID=1324776 RepID=A0AAD6HB34_9EURO|nr:hypothetical protein N7493_011584 [Penicillium malachiteum]
MPRSPTTTASSIDETAAHAAGQENSNSASSVQSIQKRGSRMRFSFQKPPTRAPTAESWDTPEPQSATMFNLVGGWFRSLRSKRSGRDLKNGDSESQGDARGSSPPRLPDLGLVGSKLDLLSDETHGFSSQQR